MTTLTITNGAESTSVVADADGSFATYMDYATGDMVNVTSPWGRDDTLTVP